VTLFEVVGDLQGLGIKRSRLESPFVEILEAPKKHVMNNPGGDWYPDVGGGSIPYSTHLQHWVLTAQNSRAWLP